MVSSNLTMSDRRASHRCASQAVDLTGPICFFLTSRGSTGSAFGARHGS